MPGRAWVRREPLSYEVCVRVDDDDYRGYLEELGFSRDYSGRGLYVKRGWSFAECVGDCELLMKLGFPPVRYPDDEEGEWDW